MKIFVGYSKKYASNYGEIFRKPNPDYMNGVRDSVHGAGIMYDPARKTWVRIVLRNGKQIITPTNATIR